SLR
ncbi:putative membrane protein, partial [Vibrio parahaemolyticus V-223/04]